MRVMTGDAKGREGRKKKEKKDTYLPELALGLCRLCPAGLTNVLPAHDRRGGGRHMSRHASGGRCWQPGYIPTGILYLMVTVGGLAIGQRKLRVPLLSHMLGWSTVHTVEYSASWWLLFTDAPQFTGATLHCISSVVHVFDKNSLGPTAGCQHCKL